MPKERQIKVSNKLHLKLAKLKIGNETYEDVIWRLPKIKSFLGK